MVMVMPAANAGLPVGTLLLPEVKVVSAENSRQLEKRFAFLWSSAHALLPTSPVLANHMIASMMQLARSSRAQLPQSVLDFVCENCGGLLVPSVSADVRVVPQTRKSSANRRLSRQQRRVQQQKAAMARALCVRLCRPLWWVEQILPRPRSESEKSRRRECYSCRDKKLKVHSDEPAEIKETKAAPVAPVELKTAPTSVFAPPPSPPRKLLDGPKRKKKKKKAQTDAAVVAVKSSLNSFLQGLNSHK
ncbi:RNAse P, Rpr2/Rpp21 subunit [Phytophthora cactorum]|nr:RNAse P, Rpr2/Rpp21 subunit [Phytophthora cactorum]